MTVDALNELLGEFDTVQIPCTDLGQRRDLLNALGSVGFTISEQWTYPEYENLMTLVLHRGDPFVRGLKIPDRRYRNTVVVQGDSIELAPDFEVPAGFSDTLQVLLGGVST